MVKEADLKKVKPKITAFYESIKTKYPVAGVVLFGSFAKGTSTPQSDIDVGVIINSSEHLKRIEITSGLFHASRKIDITIEPKCIFLDEYTHCENASILGEIKRTAITII